MITVVKPWLFFILDSVMLSIFFRLEWNWLIWCFHMIISKWSSFSTASEWPYESGLKSESILMMVCFSFSHPEPVCWPADWRLSHVKQKRLELKRCLSFYCYGCFCRASLAGNHSATLTERSRGQSLLNLFILHLVPLCYQQKQHSCKKQPL